MKKIFLILIVLSSFSLIYSSRKEEDNDNNSNVDLYSSKKMEGKYLISESRDSLDYNELWYSRIIRSVSKNSFRFSTPRGSYIYDFWMYKDGNIFYEKDIAYYGSLYNPYYSKGKIIYVPIGNPVFPYPHYEIEGAYFTDTNFTDTVKTFFLKQISYDTMPYQSK